MKTILTSLLCMSASFVLAQQPQAVTNAQITPEMLYQRGIASMNRGDVVGAEKDLRAALQAQPQHANAKYMLNQLLLNRDKIAARYRENMMKSTMIPQVDFMDATVAEALEGLSGMIGNATNKKFTPNFILKDPQGKLKDKTITLKLGNIPASQVLQYIASSAECKIAYEEHAIIVQAR